MEELEGDRHIRGSFGVEGAPAIAPTDPVLRAFSGPPRAVAADEVAMSSALTELGAAAALRVAVIDSTGGTWGVVVVFAREARGWSDDDLETGVDIAASVARELSADARVRLGALEHELDLAAVLDGLPLRIGVLDAEWRWQYLNARGAHELGRQPSALLGQSPLDLIPGWRGSPMHRELEATIASGKPRAFVTYVAPVDSWLDIRAFPLSSGIAFFMEDLTERRRAELLVLAQQRVLREMAARTPLSRTLGVLVSAVEEAFSGAGCLVVLLDEDGQTLRAGASTVSARPELSRLDGAALSDDLDLTRSAILERALLVSADLGREPRWRVDKESAFSAGWSMPILASTGAVLGAITLFRKMTGSPRAHDLEILDSAVALARVAIELERTDRELKEAATRLELVLESTGVGVIELDPIALRIQRSPSWLELIGEAGSDGSSELWFERVHPDDRARVGEWLEGRAGDALVANEFRVRHADGAYRWMLSRGMLDRDASGAVVRALATMVDITEQRTAFEAAKATARRYAALISTISESVWVTDAEGRPRPELSSWQTFTGRPRDTDWLSTVHPADVPATIAGWADMRKNPRPMVATARVLRADGEYRTMLGRSTPVRDERGEVVEWIGALLDVTEEARAREMVEGLNRDLEKRVADRTAELRKQAHLLDLLRSAVIVRDVEGRVTYWNRGAEQLYGYSREEAVGRLYGELLGIRVDEHLHESLLVEGLREREIEVTTRAGRRVFVDSRQALLRGDDDAPTAVLELNTDITERKELEEQLRKKNQELNEQNLEVQEATRLKSRFLANMSHELRTPLNGVIGFSELLFDGKVGPLDPTHREFVGDILAAGRHLLDLINDLLDLSKIEAGKMEFYPEPARIDELVASVCDSMRLSAETREIALEVDVARDVSELVVDVARWKQVVINYVSNALKFSKDRGRIQVRVGPEGAREVRLEVEDEGIGILPEDQASLFVEFLQLDSSARKKYQGTGLGLALVKRIVEAQGGRVGVRSVPAQGSTFFAVLPRDLSAFLEQEALR